MLMGVDEGGVDPQGFRPFLCQSEEGRAAFRKFEARRWIVTLPVSGSRRKAERRRPSCREPCRFIDRRDARLRIFRPRSLSGEEGLDETARECGEEIAEKNAGAERRRLSKTEMRRRPSGEDHGNGRLPEPLKDCRFPLIERYGHYLIGRRKPFFVGVPGRFLQAEQPCRGKISCFGSRYGEVRSFFGI